MTRTEILTQAIKAAKEAQEWNQSCSVEFICALVEDETGTKPDKEFADMVNLVVNPSAFRQKLEDQGILAKVPKKARTANSLFGAAVAAAK